MSETVSTYLRIGIVLMMFASLMVCVLNVTVVGTGLFGSLESKVIEGVNTGIYNQWNDIISSDKVSVPQAYKYCECNEDVIVCMPDGVTSNESKAKMLRESSHRYVRFKDCTHVIDGVKQHGYDLEFVD